MTTTRTRSASAPGRSATLALACALAASALALANAGCMGGRAKAIGIAAAETSGEPAAKRPLEPGAYAAPRGVFEVARETLRDNGYMLERVDAVSGVITTRPKTTAGIATPWHSDQSTFEQELSDFANRQQRIVRITFAPAGQAQHELAPDDLRATAGQIDMTVRVVVERLNRPGRKVDTTSVRMSSYFTDTELESRGLSWQYAVADEEDRALAERLADEILGRVGKPQG